MLFGEKEAKYDHKTIRNKVKDPIKRRKFFFNDEYYDTQEEAMEAIRKEQELPANERRFEKTFEFMGLSIHSKLRQKGIEIKNSVLDDLYQDMLGACLQMLSADVKFSQKAKQSKSPYRLTDF